MASQTLTNNICLAATIDDTEKKIRMHMARGFVVGLKAHFLLLNLATCDEEDIVFAIEKASMFARLSIMLELGEGVDNVREKGEGEVKVKVKEEALEGAAKEELPEEESPEDVPELRETAKWDSELGKGRVLKMKRMLG